MAKVSIIIPIYNVEKYLRECLDSVTKQTLDDLEIICINDGSTDSTLDIIKEYANNDNRIKIIDKKNSGYGDSMNRGLDMATGDYVGIVESDDFVEVNMFEELYKEASQHNLDIIRSQYYHYKTSDNSNLLCDNSWVPQNEIYKPIENQIPFYQAPAIWSAIYKREFLNKNNIRFLTTPGASYQDTSFAFKTYLLAERFKMIPKAFLHYRIDNECSSVNSITKASYVNIEYKEIETFSKEKKLYHKVNKLIPKIKYACYRWNHERLTKSLKWKFLWKWHLETLNDFLNGNIDKKLFTKKEFKRIKTIAFFPWLYAFRRSL